MTRNSAFSKVSLEPKPVSRRTIEGSGSKRGWGRPTGPWYWASCTRKMWPHLLCYTLINTSTSPHHCSPSVYIPVSLSSFIIRTYQDPYKRKHESSIMTSKEIKLRRGHLIKVNPYCIYINFTSKKVWKLKTRMQEVRNSEGKQTSLECWFPQHWGKRAGWKPRFKGFLG